MKDLSAYFAPNLELKWRDHVFVVPPPSKDDGLLLAALNAVGVEQAQALLGTVCETCNQPIDPAKIDPKHQAMIEAAAERDLEDISLGTEPYAQMREAGVPAPDLEMFGLYAMYYWTLGERVADSIIASWHEQRRGGASAPKASTRPKTTRATASGSRSGGTKTASRSTPTTGSRKK